MHPTMVSQLVLDLELAKTWDESDFLVTPCNDHAARLINTWPGWQSHAAIIFGPPGSGKSHLAGIWRARSGAAVAAAAELGDDPPSDPTQPLVVEDADRCAFDERALFHRLNLALEHGSTILLTARTPPGQWAVSLPDLRSRIRSYPAIAIEEPDEELLAGVLLKHFSDRQLAIAPDVIPFLLQRMERSMEAAQHLAADIDKLALSEHRRVTRAFAARILKDRGAGERDASDA